MKELFSKCRVGLNPWIALAVLTSMQVFSSCGGNCRVSAFFCPKSENFGRLKNTFELGDYWILQGGNGIVDSIYISEVQGVLDTCFKELTSCDDVVRGGTFKLSGTVHGKSLIDSEISYTLPKEEVDDENLLFM